MADVKLRQVRSSNGANPKQRDTLQALKLGKIGRESAMADTPQLRGMIKVVDHLVEVDGGS
jgi:large subunit ribosomal protein L30